MAELNWSDAQWQKVKDGVTEAFGKASIASAFLPMYGPLPGSAEIVRNERLVQDDSFKPPTIRLDGDHPGVNIKLVNVTVNVELSSEQVADDALSNALLAFRRAANILAQEQDRIVFEGFGQVPQAEDSEFVVNKVDPQSGLADTFARQKFSTLAPPPPGDVGRLVVKAVVQAMTKLEENFHPGPFACVLGNQLFEGVHDPTAALVLPADRVTPLLKGGPLLRSGKMPSRAGIVVSLAGHAVDIVIGTPPTVQFLQRNAAAKFLFRVYERFALRIRDAKRPPVAGFRIKLAENEAAAETRTRVRVATERDAVRTLQELSES
jgi:uncharacterized linocin/CFP29 family protein